MPKTRITCPNCRQSVPADVEQLFDVTADPAAKQRLLSGAVNVINCPNCRYQGNVATPIVYHDADKELLLTFVPAEMGIPRNDQERLLGGLINQVVSRLPPEKRKAYILRPQTTLTHQGLIERVLEADGITREMLQAQQARLNLVQRLATATSKEALEEMARQEDALIDAEFFTILRRLAEASMASGDQQSAQRLAMIQQIILPVTTFGAQVMAQAKEMELAVQDLRALGSGLTQEQVLELVINAPNDNRVSALVSMARPIMDYTFFQLLSERIDRARGDGRTRLVALRDNLLALTREVDEQVAARQAAAAQNVEMVLNTPNPEQVMAQNLGAVDEFFVEALNAAMEDARQKNDVERIGKLQRIASVLQQASSAPPEVALIEELLDAEDDTARRAVLEANADSIDEEFLSALSGLQAQAEQSGEAELVERLRVVSRVALRFTMEQNMRRG